MIMHMKYFLILFLLLTLTICYAPNSSACEYRRHIEDGAGRQITVCIPSNLIVLITVQEIFRILGVEDRVVGVHRWVKGLHPDENPVMAKQPIVGGFGKGDVNYEKIIEIADKTPGEDIVITYDAPWAEDIEQKLGAIEGITVFKLKLHQNIEAFDSQGALLARAVGREREWSLFQNWRHSVLKIVADRLKQTTTVNAPAVYWEASAKGHYDTVNGQSDVGGMIRLAHGINIAETLSAEKTHISPEWLLTRNPDFILSHDNNMFHLIGIRLGYNETDCSTRAQALVKISATLGIKGTNAERNRKIYFIQDDLMSGPKQVIGVMWLAKWFYPELFSDIQPEQYHEEFYERFMRIPFKGIHVYP